MLRPTAFLLVFYLLLQPCAALAGGDMRSGGASSRERTKVAAVDFANMSGRVEFDRLGQIIPEVISTNWAESGRLELVERGRLQDALQEMQLGLSGVVEAQSAAELGRAVGADAILVGSFILFGETIRITARLIDVQTGKVITGRSVDGSAPGGNLGGDVIRKMDELSRLMEESLVGEPAPVAVERAVPETPAAPPAEAPRAEATGKKGGSIFGKWWFWGLLAGAGAGTAAILAGGGGDEGATNATVTITVNVP
jgi:TolB-like protein